MFCVFVWCMASKHNHRKLFKDLRNAIECLSWDAWITIICIIIVIYSLCGGPINSFVWLVLLLLSILHFRRLTFLFDRVYPHSKVQHCETFGTNSSIFFFISCSEGDILLKADTDQQHKHVWSIIFFPRY